MRLVNTFENLKICTDFYLTRIQHIDKISTQQLV